MQAVPRQQIHITIREVESAKDAMLEFCLAKRLEMSLKPTRRCGKNTGRSK
jgi:hypothetical protein